MPRRWTASLDRRCERGEQSLCARSRGKQLPWSAVSERQGHLVGGCGGWRAEPDAVAVGVGDVHLADPPSEVHGRLADVGPTLLQLDVQRVHIVDPDREPGARAALAFTAEHHLEAVSGHAAEGDRVAPLEAVSEAELPDVVGDARRHVPDTEDRVDAFESHGPQDRQRAEHRAVQTSLRSQSTVPAATVAPTSAERPVTTPALWALSGCSIFIASSTTTRSPSATVSPSSTSTFTIVPCMGATSPSPVACVWVLFKLARRGPAMVVAGAAAPSPAGSTTSNRLPPTSTTTVSRTAASARAAAEGNLG